MNNNKLKIAVYLSVLVPFVLKAQNLNIAINNDVSFAYENEVYNNQKNFHTAIKPYNNSEIKNYWKIKNRFKTEKSKKLLFFGDTSRFIEIKPIFDLGATYSYNDYTDNTYHNYSLGVEICSQITHNLSFDIKIAQSENPIPTYHLASNETFLFYPHYGESKLKKNYSYLRGYISYSPGDYFNFQFGHDKNFFGDGYRSLLLSDNSDAFWFLKGSVNIWKVKYTILYSGFQDIDSKYEYLSKPSVNQSLLDKYSTSHFLSWNIGKRFNFNLFETVIWRGEDSLGTRGFDVNYINPIVFFRPIEFSIGSPDNVLMGGGFKVKIGKSNHLYGQFILDEFKLSEIKAKNGWWGNKYGFQLGFKTYNLFNIKNLYFLAEYNRVRPFTYSHRSSLENWGNMNQAMAHPLGANFTEEVFIIKYPHKRFLFKIKTVFSQHGVNYPNYQAIDMFAGDYTNEINYGGDIYVSYLDRVNEYGNTQNQGYLQKLSYIDLSTSYLIVPDWSLYFTGGFTNVNINNKNNYLIHFGFKSFLYNDDVDF